MDEQRYRFGVGVLVVASVVVGVILIMFFGAAPNFLARRYKVTVNFPAAPGVGADTPVRKNGVNVGRVKQVRLLNDEQGVDLELELDNDFQIKRAELCRVGTGSLITGDAIVEFVPPTRESLMTRFDGRDGLPKDGSLSQAEEALAKSPLKDGDFMDGGVVAADPFAAFVTMQEKFTPTFAAVEQASNQVGMLARDFRSIINGDQGQLKQIVQKTEQTLENFNQTLDAIEGVFGDPKLRASLQTSAERLPALLDSAESVLSETKGTIASFSGVGRAAEQAMQNVAEFTEPLGDQGEKFVADTIRTLNNIDGLVSDLRMVSSRLNSSQGTFNKLLNDDEMYNTLKSTLENVEQLSRRLQPVVEDVRIFTDKISRDPRQLGLAGALQARPVGLGTK